MRGLDAALVGGGDFAENTSSASAWLMRSFMDSRGSGVAFACGEARGGVAEEKGNLPPSWAIANSSNDGKRLESSSTAPARMS